MRTKLKLLTISDHPLICSGVGSQTKYLLEGLLKTGDYTIRSFGAALSHSDKRALKIEPYGDDWIVLPTEGYGNPQLLRGVLDAEKPDALWIMTDPRFYVWLFEMADELEERGIPILYNTIWDCNPTPTFNKPYYDACSFLGCISKLTYNIMLDLGLDHKSQYIPHAVDADIFKPSDEVSQRRARIQHLGEEQADKFIVFYNSRNARRKMTADVIETFKMFLDKVGHDKAFLFMHTDPNDQEGSNLTAVAEMLKLTPRQVRFDPAPKPPETIAQYYNMSDVLVNISNNEGFGLSCLEALSCGTLAIVNKTGGLQDQITDPETGEHFGVSIEPASRSIQGSQQIPFIYDERAASQDVVNALEYIYNMPRKEYRAKAERAREYTLRAFAMKDLITKWDKAIKNCVEHRSAYDANLKVVNF